MDESSARRHGVLKAFLFTMMTSLAWDEILLPSAGSHLVRRWGQSANRLQGRMRAACNGQLFNPRRGKRCAILVFLSVSPPSGILTVSAQAHRAGGVVGDLEACSAARKGGCDKVRFLQRNQRRGSS